MDLVRVYSRKKTDFELQDVKLLRQRRARIHRFRCCAQRHVLLSFRQYNVAQMKDLPELVLSNKEMLGKTDNLLLSESSGQRQIVIRLGIIP